MRPAWDDWALGIAEAAAVRGDCTRKKVGAVIVSPDKRIVPGYNGVPAGQRGCLDGGCPRGRHYHKENSWFAGCACGKPWPCPDAAEPGSSYDTGPGACRAIHADVNAILRSSWEERQRAIMYVTCEPCTGCLKIIAGSGILRVVWRDGSLRSLDYPFLHYSS